jgi:NAD(P)-dependent dehydrogenase (short-subunit alcohol dehydrogenase family)
MVERALNKFRAIDILVNNAAPTDRGLKGLSLSQDTPEALWDKYTAIIQKGCVLCCQAVGKHMVKRESGKIVNISSNLGLVAIPGYAPYCTNKAAVLHLTRVLAVEWGRYNINVNSVSPGNTNTGIMTRHGTTPTPEVAATLPESKSVRFDAPVAEWLGRYPIQRYNEPEDIANAVLFLASAEARNITGQNLTVDGGISILNPMYIWPEQ